MFLSKAKVSFKIEEISNQPEADKYRINPPLADKKYPIMKEIQT